MTADGLWVNHVDLHIWYRFRDHLLNNNRHIPGQEFTQFIEFIKSSVAKRQCVIKPGIETYYRARQKWKWQDLPGGRKTVAPCDSADLLAPPPGHNYEGRLNPRGMSYLYLSDMPETAIAEIRPWIGEWVSVGTFHLSAQQKFVDLRAALKNSIIAELEAKAKNRDYSEIEIQEFVWGDIHSDFSNPVKSDNSSEYIASQYLASIFKDAGYDGVLYKSSVYPQCYNTALFRPDMAVLQHRAVYEVEEISYRTDRKSEWFSAY